MSQVQLEAFFLVQNACTAFPSTLQHAGALPATTNTSHTPRRRTVRTKYYYCKLLCLVVRLHSCTVPILRGCRLRKCLHIACGRNDRGAQPTTRLYLLSNLREILPLYIFLMLRRNTTLHSPLPFHRDKLP
jgi:hypothetical protein